MNEFIFDLQRFAYTVLTPGGAAVTITASTYFDVSGVTTAVYLSNDTTNEVKVSADTSGKIQIQIVKGTIVQIFDHTNKINAAFTLLLPSNGIYKPYYHGQDITLGTGGPTINVSTINESNIFLNVTQSTASDPAYFTITTSANSFSGFALGNFSIPWASSLSFSMQDGKSNLTWDSSSANYTFKYHNENAEDENTAYSYYTPSNGTFTVTVDNATGDFSVSGLENGESFTGQTGNASSATGEIATYFMAKTRLLATDGATTKFSAQRDIGGTILNAQSALNFDSDFFVTVDGLIDGTDYYTLLNPGLASLLTDGSAAVQYNGTTYSTTGVAMGVGTTAVTMEVPEKLSVTNVTRLLIDIAPPNNSDAILNIFFPYNTASLYFQVTITTAGTMEIKTYANSQAVDTTGEITLADYGVSLNKPIRLELQTDLAGGFFTNTYVKASVGRYSRTQQLATNISFDNSNLLLSFVSGSDDEVQISDIIVRDEKISSIAERIFPLPVSATTTNMTEDNGVYTANEVDQTLLQTPDVTDLIASHGSASAVKAIAVIGNPAYRTGENLKKLTAIDKVDNTVTEHGSVEVKSSPGGTIIDNWAPANTTLADLADMQFGWKAEA